VARKLALIQSHSNKNNSELLQMFGRSAWTYNTSLGRLLYTEKNLNRA